MFPKLSEKENSDFEKINKELLIAENSLRIAASLMGKYAGKAIIPAGGLYEFHKLIKMFLRLNAFRLDFYDRCTHLLRK